MGKFVDAALNGAAGQSGKAFFFKGHRYWQYDWNTDQGDADFPQPLDDWEFPPGFNKGIDAAVEGRESFEGKALFFKGTKIVRYDWKTEKFDKPLDLIADLDLPPTFCIGKKIDAAVNGAGKDASSLYLFSGGKNWAQFDWKKELRSSVVKLGSFQKDWEPPAELTKGMDGALSGWGKKYGNKAYFFSGKTYARFDWGADKWDFKNGDLGAWKLPGLLDE